MSPRDLAGLLLRNSWLIGAALVLALIGTAIFTASRLPLWEATAKTYVTAETGSSITDVSTGSTFAQQAAKGYADLATTSAVLQPVIDDLSLATTVDRLAERLQVTALPDGPVIQIIATATSAEQARRIADAVSARLSDAVTSLASKKGAGVVRLTQVDPAIASTGPVSPSMPVNLALAALVGLLLGLGIALLREAANPRVRSAADAASLTALPVLGRIARTSDTRPIDPRSSRWNRRVEAYRALRGALEFLDVEPPAGLGRCFVVTSAATGEGKTSTAVNLALSIAQLGRRVLLVDADLRRSRASWYLKVQDSSVGLVEVLTGKSTLEEMAQPRKGSTLSVLPAGKVRQNAGELLQGSAMAELVEQARRGYDVVIIDAPPLLPVSDAAVLARRSDGAIVVVAAGSTPKRDLQAALESLELLHARVLGLVVTRLAISGPAAEPSSRYSPYEPVQRRLHVR